VAISFYGDGGSSVKKQQPTPKPTVPTTKTKPKTIIINKPAVTSAWNAATAPKPTTPAVKPAAVKPATAAPATVKPAATPSSVKPAAVTPASVAPAAAPANVTPAADPTTPELPAMPTYNGMTSEEFIKALTDKATSGVNTAADSQINTIANNLAEALSNYDSETADSQARNKKMLEQIHNNEFVTGETSKEMMNQSGWNPTNSGLAIGELDRVKIGADKERADANASLEAELADISRRANLARTRAGNDKSDVEKWRASQLSGVGADAMLQADQRNYGQYRDTVGDYWTKANYDYGVSRDKVSDSQWQKQYEQSGKQWQDSFDYQKERDKVSDSQWKAGYDYQASRDKVLDNQWLSQFNSSEQQRLIENAVANKQISISEGNLALQKAAQAWAQNPNNPDNIYKTKQIEGLNSKDTTTDEQTIGAFYSAMMNSKDPAKWLKQNAQYLTNDEIKALQSYLPKDSTSSLTMP
jgi:hypothetical protein